MSPFWLLHIMKKYEFSLVEHRSPSIGDIDKNVIYVFKKVTEDKGLTRSIDEISASLDAKHLNALSNRSCRSRSLSF